jgi:hypothetical protein
MNENPSPAPGAQPGPYDDEGQMFVPAGWCAPSDVIYDIAQELAEHPIDYNEVGVWPQAVRGGVTYNVTFNSTINSDSFRILTGYQYPPELETLL